MTMYEYERAATKMKRYAASLMEDNGRGLITKLEAVDKFSAYVRCMVDNELCGAGYGATRIDEFKEKILK